MCKEDYGWNPTTCICENGKYPGSIIDNSVIRCDDIIQTTKSIIAKIVLVKTVLTNFDEKR